MCRFWATTFPCGCFTWRSSGYSYCQERGKCKISLKMYKWKTFCPRSRKALRGRTNHCKTLCRKCDSIPTDPSKGPTLWHCPDHLELVSEESDASLAEAEAFFGKAVALWPADTRARYLRRKADKTFKDVWWSY